jgi:hypothetical protein
MKKVLFKTLPWVITVGALYLAFSGVDWQELLSHAGVLVSKVDPTVISHLSLLVVKV